MVGRPAGYAGNGLLRQGRRARSRSQNRVEQTGGGLREERDHHNHDQTVSKEIRS